MTTQTKIETEADRQTPAPQAPKGPTEFRTKTLAKDPPAHLPKDIVEAAQAIAGTGPTVEIRLAKATEGEDPRWVVFVHGSAKRSLIKAALGDTPHDQDTVNKAVWLRNFDPKTDKPEQPAKPQATQPKAASKPAASRGTGLCLCGCGGATKATFAMGHDARFYGWLAEFQATGSCDRANDDPVTQAALRSWELPEKKQYLKNKWLNGGTTPAQPAKAKEPKPMVIGTWAGPATVIR